MHTPPPPARQRSRRYAISIAVMALASVSATLIATASGSAATGRTASTPRCATSELVIWLDTQGNGAAGSITYHVEFTNLSGHRCTLFGYPGMSAVNLAGRQLGSAASRDRAQAAHTVTLRNGDTATALVRIVNADNFPSSSCAAVTAAGLRVFPPDQAAAKVIPFPFGACSRSGPTYLFVRAIR